MLVRGGGGLGVVGVEEQHVEAEVLVDDQLEARLAQGVTKVGGLVVVVKQTDAQITSPLVQAHAVEEHDLPAGGDDDVLEVGQTG
jgi:hypothetical protein